jgi:hypothetical protein
MPLANDCHGCSLDEQCPRSGYCERRERMISDFTALLLFAADKDISTLTDLVLKQAQADKETFDREKFAEGFSECDQP